MKLPLEAKHGTETLSSSDRLRFVEIPADDSTKDLISPNTILTKLVEHNKPRVAKIVRGITESGSARLAGFVVDMFCIAMADVADELGSPSFLYFTSSAASLGHMYYLQAKRDEEHHDVTELKDSESELSIPSYINSVPAKVLPTIVFDKDGGSKMFLDLAERFRKSKAIMVNTFQELESHALESFLSGYGDVPPVFPVGPIVNLKNTTDARKATDEVMTWLNEQPESSVAFLCFGSTGSFGEEQVKEIAVAIERSGQRFLWSLRRPPKGKMEYPREFENPAEVLPEGFLERTSSIGKVIGWAPQTAVLSHPSVGGFVSHCGWNSTLESIWYGVPIAAWPIDAEQQLNAFQLLVEFGMAAEIKMDYRTNMRPGGKEVFVTAKEIESGIRRLMGDSEIKNKVKMMKEKSRTTISNGGSSYRAIRRFIDDHLLIN